MVVDPFEFGRAYAEQRNQRTYNPATQHVPESGGNVNFDELSDVVKTPLKAVLWAFDQSNKYVARPGLGALGKAIANQGPLGRATGTNLANAPFVGDRWKDPEFVQAMNAGSNTEAFNTMYEGRPFQRFAAEAVVDPLNLLGIGVLPAAARGVGVGAKGVRNIQRGEDLVNAALSAPVTVPFRAVRGGVRKIAGDTFEKSGSTKANEEIRDVVNFLHTLRDQGVPLNLDDIDGSLAQVSPEVMAEGIGRATQTGNVEALLNDADDGLLGRTYDFMAMNGDLNTEPVKRVLQSRGLMNEAGEKSGRLEIHQQLDEISDAFQHGVDERQAWKFITDYTANQIWKNNTRTYDSIDDVYKIMKVQRLGEVPEETGNELFQRLSKREQQIDEMLNKFEPKENIAELLRDPSVRNAGIWNWYARSGEFMYNMGFDHSRAFTDEQAEWLFNQPQLQEVMTNLNISPEAAMGRLKSISKIDAMSQFIGAGSMNEGPKRNLYTAMTAYKNILEGRMAPFEGFRIPADVQKKEGIQGPSIPSAFDMSGQYNKAYAGLIMEEGLLPDAFIRKLNKGKTEYPGHADPVHGQQDKMFLFARILKEETDAYATYRSALENGMDAGEAMDMYQDVRRQIQGYVSDAWDRRGMYELEGRLSDDVIEAGLETGRVNKKGQPVPNKFKKSLEERPSGGEPSWFAAKHFIHNEIYPYLTGRMPHGGAYDGPTVSPEDMQMFRIRYANPGALQADLWGRFRFREKNAVIPALKELASDPDEYARVLNEEGPQGIRNRFGALVRQFMGTDEYKAGQQEFSDESQDFLDVADYEGGTFSNPELGRELAPQVRSGEGYRTATGDVLPYAPEQDVEAMFTGDYTPLMQTLADDLKAGMFQMGEGQAVVSFFPRASMSTPIHEIMGHGTRFLSSGEQQANIRRSVGQPVYRNADNTLNDAANQAQMPTEAEEQFARGAEQSMYHTVPNTQPEAEEFGRVRRLLELEYMRNQGIDVPDYRIDNLYQQSPINVQQLDHRAVRRLSEGRPMDKDIRRLIRSGDYVGISPRIAEDITDPALAQKMNMMEQELRNLGYEPIRADGIYGGEIEPSFIVPGMSREDAVRMGEQYGQESVLYGREGLVYTDGSGQVVRNLPDPVEFTDDTDNMTRITRPDGKQIQFRQPLDFPDDEGVTAAQRTYEESRQATRFSDPRSNASLEEVLDQLAMESGLAPEAATAVSDQVSQKLAPFMERNPHLRTISLWHNPRISETLRTAMQAGDPQAIDRALEDVAYELDGIWGELGMNHPALNKWAQRLLPKDLRKSVIVQSEAYGRRPSGSRLSEQQLRTAENLKAMEKVNQVEENYAKARRSLVEIAADIHSQNRMALDIDDNTTFADLQELRKFANDKQKKILDDFMKTFNLPEFEPDDVSKINLRQLEERDIIIAAQKEVAKKYNLKWGETPKGLSKAFQTATRAWREQALFSPRYHAANGLDMLVKSTIFGVNVLRPEEPATKFLQNVGRSEFPAGVRVENIMPENEVMRTEFQSGREGVLTQVPVIGRGIEWSQNFARAMENSVREAAFAHGAREHLMRNIPSFEAQLRRDLGDDVANTVLDMMNKTRHGVSFSTDQLVGTIVDAGGDARTASRLGTIWDASIDDAFEEGRSLSNLVHFDFADERVIEEKLHLRKWAPFHFWATRNIPFYIDTLAAHPHLVRAWANYYESAEIHAEEQNNPNRLNQMMPLPGPMDDFLDMLFGPGKSYFNPMVVLSLADQAKPRFEDQDQPWLGRQLDKLQSVGLAPAPWFSYPLSVLGVYGVEDEQMPVLRHSSLLKNATGLMGIDPQGTGGIDVEQPLRELTKRGREGLLNKKVQTISGSAYKDYQISKRLAEMSLERTGQANHPDFTAAMRDTSHPLYKEAERDVQEVNMLTDLQHFVSPIPHKRIPEMEQAVRSSQADLPEGAMADRDFRDALVQSGDPAGAYLRTPKPKVLEPVWQDQYGNVQGGGQQYGSSSPQDALAWGGSVWGPDKPPPFNLQSVYQSYINRVNRSGYMSPQQFVRMVSNPIHRM